MSLSEIITSKAKTSPFLSHHTLTTEKIEQQDTREINLRNITLYYIIKI